MVCSNLGGKPYFGGEYVYHPVSFSRTVGETNMSPVYLRVDSFRFVEPRAV